MIQNSLHCSWRCLITASAVILYSQLQFKTKQTNTQREEDDSDLLQTSLPHLMDSGIKVEFNRDGGFLRRAGGEFGRVNGLKGL